MALQELDLKTIERDGHTFQFKYLSGIAASRCIWKLTKPATAVINGPVNLAMKLWHQLKSSGAFDKDENGEEKEFGFNDLLSLEAGDMKDLIKEVVDALKELVGSMTEDEYVELLVSLFKGMTVQTRGNAPMVVNTAEDFDKAFTGVMVDDVMLLALEVMRFNRFPFLRKVEKDFGELLETMNIFKEDSESEENLPKT